MIISQVLNKLYKNIIKQIKQTKVLNQYKYKFICHTVYRMFQQNYFILYNKFFFDSMDYVKFKQYLSKYPQKWNVDDIEIWLRFIGLQNLYPIFKNASIDGSCLMSLTEEDLKNQLQIKSGIAIKKLMMWIRVGMTEYKLFLEQIEKQSKTILHKNKQQAMIPNREIKNLTSKTIRQPKYFNLKLNKQPQKIQNQSRHKITTIEKKEINQNQINHQLYDQFQLIIHEIENARNTFYSLKQQGSKIGRHSSNQIVIYDESVSRFHAEITFINKQFYIQDVGSTTGTFIKLQQKTELIESMIFQLGSNHFYVEQIYQHQIKLRVIDGPNLHDEIEIELKKNKVSIGRKINNQISFPDDQHLSNMHAHIFRIQNKIYIEDLQSTNGTWLRLSPEGQKSKPYLINHQTIFKIGPTLTYICEKKSILIVQKKIVNACAICYQNQKDCLYIPCNHNAACIGCSKNLRECPICRLKIEDFIKIYST